MTVTAEPSLATLFDPANRADPYPVLAGLRSAPRTELDGALVVVGDYRNCATILRDPTVSADRRNSLLGATFGDTPDEVPFDSFLSMDAPDHTRLRGLVSKAFTPRVIANLEPRIREIVADQLTKAGEANAIEVVSQLANILPVTIINDLLGVPARDHDILQDWSHRLVRGLDPATDLGDPVVLADIELAKEGFRLYFADLVAFRREKPADDLLSHLVRIEQDGEVLTEAELLATCALLLVGGYESTANLIANGVLALLRHPDQLQALRENPGLASAAVDEVLRYDTPAQMVTRVARREMSVEGVTVPNNGVIMLLLAAANRDPAVFSDPDRFDLRRGANHHLAFAAGPHFCIGSSLAKLETSIALSEFARRVQAPELDESLLTYRPHVNLRGPERMFVRFDNITN
ncbi:cytochrome P450 [Actinokineospora sp. NBRC 105648]|uniref:cytochrome P450 n=1 Tax=Actinokineospora sp. NBRC 105648 TaxID=3032206 RepID=UPI0024A42DF5|nr:cytochrome P450 [Actinokineospora sp. NBRC 105648]GLZ39213.1 cytochrome P450 [Actinokineospora sp. NBRC 105648]